MRREKDFFEDPENGERSVRNLWRAIDTEDRAPRRRSLWTVLTLSATVAVLFAVLWYSYPREVEIRDRLSAPLIRADSTPARVAPDEPGGMDIPHRDSAVFGAMNSADAAENPPVENLLAAEEEPMPRARLFAGLNTETIESESASEGSPAEISADMDVPVQTISRSGDADALPEDQAAPAPKPSLSASQDSVKNPPPKLAVRAEKQTEKAPSLSEESSAPKTIPSAAQAAKAARTEPAAGAALGSATRGTHYVQLSSVRDRGQADREWASLKRQFSDPLGGLSMRVQEADLGAKGTYYRIQAGPVSKERATTLCAAIKKNKPGGCLVVGR